MNRDPENDLRRFKLAAPPDGLRERVLAAVRAKNARRAEEELSPAFRFGVKCFLAAAAIMLAAIIALNSWSDPTPTTPTTEMQVHNPTAKQLEQLGLTPEQVRAACVVRNAVNKPGPAYRFIHRGDWS